MDPDVNGNSEYKEDGDFRSGAVWVGKGCLTNLPETSDYLEKIKLVLYIFLLTPR